MFKSDGSTLFLAAPPSARFCLARWDFARKAEMELTKSKSSQPQVRELMEHFVLRVEEILERHMPNSEVLYPERRHPTSFTFSDPLKSTKMRSSRPPRWKGPMKPRRRTGSRPRRAVAASPSCHPSTRRRSGTRYRPSSTPSGTTSARTSRTAPRPTTVS